MRKLLFILFFIPLLAYSQTDVTVVDPNANNSFSLPMDAEYNYSYSQQIYYKADIGNSGDINTISFKWEGGTMNINTLIIYMADVSYDSFNNNTDWEVIGNLTQVYSGSYNLGTLDTWYTITLDNAFTHDNTKNLLIAFDKNSSENCWPCSDVFNTKYTAPDIFTYPSIEYHSDGTNPDPSAPPSASNIQYYVPGLKINITPVVLPIELLYFNTELVDGLVKIGWSTASEINNDYFEIEKIVNNNWVTIGRIDGAGNSSTKLDYHIYSDIIDYGDNYYRLKQTDYDGQYSYSSISILEYKVVKLEENYQIIDLLGRDTNNGFKIKR